MNRKAIMVAGGVHFVAVVASVLASASKGHSDVTVKKRVDGEVYHAGFQYGACASDQ